MASNPKALRFVQFGSYEVDFAVGELRKNGAKIKLQDRPFEILKILLERPGEIVNREEFRQRLWPADTFVDFDHSLNASVNKLRLALDDGADNPLYVATAGRRGYRFIAPILAKSQTAQSPPADKRPQDIGRTETQTVGGTNGRRILVIASGLAVLAGALGTARLLPRRTSKAFTEKDSVLLADFDNATGETVFDGALKEGLAVQLGQSPFLNFVPEDRVRETLRFMGHPPSEKLLPRIAREVCERVNAKAFVSGSIVRLGSHYVLAVDAVNCQNGAILARDQVDVDSKDQVLQALGQSARKVRGELGESLGSIQKFDVPIAQATTASLDALKAYSLGDEERDRGAETEAISLFLRAIELDPQFAMAYGRVAATYNNLGESQKASEYLKKAFDLREHVSVPEKLYLEIRYYQIVTGETEKATQTYEFWKEIYPRDWTPYNGLAARYQIIGQYDKAVEAARTALKLAPDKILPYANLASSYRSLNLFAEAKAVCESAISAKRDSSYTHAVSFEIAHVLGDQTAMKQELAWARGTPRETDMLTAQALVEASSGRLRSARRLFDAAHESARKYDLEENASFSIAWEALAEADFGNFPRSLVRAKAALALGHGIDVQETAAEALAVAGDVRQAQMLADDLHQRFPQHTPLNGVSLPTILASIALRGGSPDRAIELLRPAIPYDLSEFSSLAAVYIRGQAYLSAGLGKEAAGEFQKILVHSGINPTGPRHVLARLGLARAYALSGEIQKSREAYAEFFVLWKDADPDLPILRQAKLEYARMKKIAS